MQQHLQTKAHKNLMTKFNARPERQTLLTDPAPAPNAFVEDMCEMFLAAGIPWNKATNHKFVEFMQKYASKRVPDESTLRKNYLPKLYTKVLWIHSLFDLT